MSKNSGKKWHKLGDIRVSNKDGVKKTRVVLSQKVKILVLNEKTGQYEEADVNEYGSTFLKPVDKMVDDLESMKERGIINAEDCERQKARLEEKGIKYEIILPPND